VRLCRDSVEVTEVVERVGRRCQKQVSPLRSQSLASVEMTEFNNFHSLAMMIVKIRTGFTMASA
jgi:hypothetical protein